MLKDVYEQNGARLNNLCSVGWFYFVIVCIVRLFFLYIYEILPLIQMYLKNPHERSWIPNNFICQTSLTYVVTYMLGSAQRLLLF